MNYFRSWCRVTYFSTCSTHFLILGQAPSKMWCFVLVLSPLAHTLYARACAYGQLRARASLYTCVHACKNGVNILTLPTNDNVHLQVAPLLAGTHTICTSDTTNQWRWLWENVRELDGAGCRSPCMSSDPVTSYGLHTRSSDQR